VVIDEGLLLGTVRVVNPARKAAHAENVRVQLGKIADDGRYFDVWVVADDLADLESRGKLKLAPAFAWGGSESTPKARIQYRPS
jgi:S1-C subfamily serine protease